MAAEAPDDSKTSHGDFIPLNGYKIELPSILNYPKMYADQIREYQVQKPEFVGTIGDLDINKPEMYMNIIFPDSDELEVFFNKEDQPIEWYSTSRYSLNDDEITIDTDDVQYINGQRNGLQTFRRTRYDVDVEIGPVVVSLEIVTITWVDDVMKGPASYTTEGFTAKGQFNNNKLDGVWKVTDVISRKTQVFYYSNGIPMSEEQYRKVVIN